MEGNQPQAAETGDPDRAKPTKEPKCGHWPHQVRSVSQVVTPAPHEGGRWEGLEKGARKDSLAASV